MATRARCTECNRNFPNEDALRMHKQAKHSLASEKKNGSQKRYIIAVVSIAFVLFIGYFILNSYGRNVSGDAIDTNSQTSSKEIQQITLGFKDYNYYPNTIKVKAGLPVEITLDNSVRGCFRAFSIRQLGISQYSATPDNKIRFTPDKKGTFEFACSMRMAYGSMMVE